MEASLTGTARRDILPFSRDRAPQLSSLRCSRLF